MRNEKFCEAVVDCTWQPWVWKESHLWYNATDAWTCKEEGPTNMRLLPGGMRPERTQGLGMFINKKYLTSITCAKNAPEVFYVLTTTWTKIFCDFRKSWFSPYNRVFWKKMFVEVKKFEVNLCFSDYWNY